jgi:RecB family exonuclease
MQLPSLKHLFSKGLRIENEREILTATKRFRPDRVVFLPDRVVVVDYKTGTPQDEHAAQIRRYVSLYLQMGHAQVEGLLVYLDRSHTQVVAC